MKSIKKIALLLVVPVLLLSLSSCKKQLEEVPYSFLSPNNFYKNQADAITAVNGVYSALYSWDMYLQPMWNLTMLDDDHVSGADWYLGTAGAGNPQGYWGVDGPWVGCYTMIARANTVMENIVNIETDIDADIKKRVLGEAHFLRGWAYLQLVQLYGGVPLRLQSLSVNPEANIPRSSVQEVYAAIIADFKNAEIMLFPVGHAKAGELGRVTSGVAKGFLAKTYVTMASGSLPAATITVRGGQDNGYYTHSKNVVAGLEGLDSRAYFTLARDKALEVINSREYSLFTNFKDIWTKANRNRQEHMWELQSLAGSLFENQIHNYLSATSTFGRGAVWATNNHFIDHEDNDTRALDGIRHNYQSSTGFNYFYPSWQSAQYQVVGGVSYSNNGTSDNRAYTIKYSDVANPTVTQSDAFVPLMRYSEMFLIAAEADNEINGGPSLNAYAYIDTIRGRARASYASPGMSQAQFRSFVLAERAREYTLEGVRRFDLMRWGIYLQVMNKISAGQNNISKVRSLRNLLLPIPQSEINSNNTINSNNPGW